ncbi:uncharacterized protein H6S33_010340 [Morchella sextelata]|uniref:uncharacterized protein n=1 Tax=Morchella sextelata TaxID=1174677 RepID=UPI001D044B00|nr:uncharacterized protein H6S33_010340 [Morchella sextelata]KAH0612288.1 hypothetical protein H6S33_010340 [Morchella sextelata]
MPLLSTLNPALRTLLPTIGFIYALQTAVAIPSIIFQTERFYDLSGSLTYLSCTLLSLYFPAYRARSLAAAEGLPIPVWPAFTDFHPRQLILSGLTALWAARLGSFLFDRVLRDGSDSRFDKIKKNPTSFAIAFFAQATWITLVSLPIMATNSLPAAVLRPLRTSDYLGLTLWASGFLLEVAADRQKASWTADKRAKKHSEDFLHTGLWALSRHPNYAGETTLWIGSAVIAGLGGGLAGGVGTKFYGGAAVGAMMSAVSPAFTYWLLTRVSGVPLSERKYDERFGGRKEYEAWKRNTPVFWPKLF